MKKSLKVFIVGGLLTAAFPAAAQFTLSGTDVNSWGAFGDANNGTFSGSYGGPSTVFSNLRVTGTLNAVAPGTWGEDSVFDFTNTGDSSFFQFRPELLDAEYTSLSVDRSVETMIWVNSGANFLATAFETFDDDSAGNDAVWANVSATMSGSVSSTGLGTLANSFTIHTRASDFDTQLAIYAADGTLVAFNDDIDFAGGNYQSEIVASGLADGDYYLVAGGYSTAMSDRYVVAGFGSDTEFGFLDMALDGSSIGSGALGSNELQVYNFTVGVVPEPATMSALALGFAALLRRRKKA